MAKNGGVVHLSLIRFTPIRDSGDLDMADHRHETGEISLNIPPHAASVITVIHHPALIRTLGILTLGLADAAIRSAACSGLVRK